MTNLNRFRNGHLEHVIDTKPSTALSMQHFAVRRQERTKEQNWELNRHPDWGLRPVMGGRQGLMFAWMALWQRPSAHAAMMTQA
jgi:hypothetical protein